jgi:hypothetical protein
VLAVCLTGWPRPLLHCRVAKLAVQQACGTYLCVSLCLGIYEKKYNPCQQIVGLAGSVTAYIPEKHSSFPAAAPDASCSAAARAGQGDLRR